MNIVADNLWQFHYKQGSAPKSGVVRGANEDEAYRVAVRWCQLNGVRPPAKVFPMILADPSIFDVHYGPEVPAGSTLVGAIPATTSPNGR